MNSHRESEPAPIHTASPTPRRFSRRGLFISFFNRLSLCGLMSTTSRPSVAEEKSREFSNLARYVTPHDITAAMARRNRIAKYLRETDAPEVGIFWFIQESGGAPKILAFSVALQQGKAYGMYIDSPEDHVSFFRTMKRIMGPVLHDSGPKDWPRGRVLFNTAMKHFEVDLNKQLLAPHFRAKILDHFRLPEASTVFSPDPHYAETRFTFGSKGPQERALVEAIPEALNVESPTSPLGE